MLSDSRTLDIKDPDAIILKGFEVLSSGGMTKFLELIFGIKKRYEELIGKERENSDLRDDNEAKRARIEDLERQMKSTS